MEENTSVDAAQIAKLCDEFSSVTDTIWAALGENAFRNLTKITEKNPVQKFSKPIHPAIFDAVSIATARFLRDSKKGSLECFTTDNYKALLNNAEFIDCISIRTTNTDKLERRVELAGNYLFGI